MLREVFNPNLSDRRSEGDRFIPPDTDAEYIQELRCLVKEEECNRERRKHAFFSKDFSCEGPGQLFPSSWRASFQISSTAAAQATGSGVARLLHERPDYKTKAALPVLEAVVNGSVPEFCKGAEDGMKFRIYRFGSLEVRTTQAYGGSEEVGVVFSVQAPQASSCEAYRSHFLESDRITKATIYVVDGSAQSYHVYCVFETDHGSTVVTERFDDGTITWEVDPVALDVRNSLARVCGSDDCRGAKVTVRDIALYKASQERMAVNSSWAYAAGARRRALRGTAVVAVASLTAATT